MNRQVAGVAKPEVAKPGVLGPLGEDISPLGEEEPNGGGAYTPTQRLINIAGVTVFAALCLHAGGRVAEAAEPLSTLGTVGLVLAGIAAAIPLADFLSGLVHWAADNWGSDTWPIVGGFVGPFRHHHVAPKAMTEHGFLERFGDNIIATMPLFAAGATVDGSPAWRVFAGTFWLATAFWILLTAQFHAWAHMDEPPRFARGLQRLHLILTPEHHAKHHLPPHNSHYCITTGWLDAPLRRIGFWRGLEALLTALTGVQPLHRTAAEAESDPGIADPPDA